MQSRRDESLVVPRWAMRTTGLAAALATVLSALAVFTAAVVHGSAEDILEGSYDVMGPNSLIDRWVIAPHCTEAVVGCVADIQSSLITGQASYRGAHTWVMVITGQVPVCPDKSKTMGAMVFQWNAVSLQGQLTSIQRGLCQMTRPGQEYIPFTLARPNN